MTYRSLTESEWRKQAEQHCSLVAPWLAGFRERRLRGESHPVYDFLFTYYTAPRKVIERWHPGFGILLEGGEARQFLKDERYVERKEGGVCLDLEKQSPSETKRIRWVSELLQRAGERAPRLNCFGLHEWAMVYRSGDIRHEQVPLRMKPAALAEFVESQKICCSHYDAFRFFTPAAKPLNMLFPEQEKRREFEQPGCVHFNMDLYKWCYKLYPWVGSSLVRRCFELALKARRLDMQASPYDLSDYDLEPIFIETPEGRLIYQQQQQALMQEAEPLRLELVDCCQVLLPS